MLRFYKYILEGSFMELAHGTATVRPDLSDRLESFLPSLRTAFIAVTLALMAKNATASTCAPNSTEPVDTVRQMYVDIAAGDKAKTIGAFDPEGFLFDGGARFTPESIADLILKAEAAGTKPQWKIEGAESHTACNIAWATWTNRGSFTTAAGVEPKTWLESAVFVWRDGAWKIRFFHSTPVEHRS
jgi:hypothetical protein